MKPTTKFDILVVGGGPAGASAAWTAARAGASVVLLDRAVFPRDKACGDALIPAATKVLERMGLAQSLSLFHRVDRMRYHGAADFRDFPFPSFLGKQTFGYVVQRSVFDELVLRHAEAAGVKVRDGSEAIEPLFSAGRAVGARICHGRREEDLRASAIVVADGATSPFGRMLGLGVRRGRPVGVAVRAQIECARPDDSTLDFFLTLESSQGDALPGYGWVFPMGGGRINVGVGLSSARPRSGVNVARVFEAFLGRLPATWRLPRIEQIRAEGRVRGALLPMAFAVSPPFRPGALAAGDAAGLVNAFNGEGIFEAIESGMLAATHALTAIDHGGTQDLSSYGDALRARWGWQSWLGRRAVSVIERPRVMRGIVTAAMRLPWVLPCCVSLSMRSELRMLARFCDTARVREFGAFSERQCCRS